MAKLPDKVGKYKILSLVGKGGMGIVYAAEHPTLKRKVILKKLTIRDKEFRERFRMEADMMMDLRSDYIVDMYDHFREGSSYYIAMEFIEGITLDELIHKIGPLDYDLLVYIMSCTSKALQYIHDRGIIHRDIKPSNIYISKRGDVKLGDFGIASSASRNVKITDSGSAMGTPAYMAPEQFNDSSTVDLRADIFSFGVTLYESISGMKPFRAEKYTELKQEIGKGRYKRLSIYKKNLPLFLRLMILRCLFVLPVFRPKDMKSIKNRFNQELKKVGLIKVKERLSSLIESGTVSKKSALTKVVKETPEEKKNNNYKILIILLLTVFFFLFIYWGGIYKIFLNNSYGQLVLSMIPVSEEGKYTIYKFEEEYFIKSEEGRFNQKGLASHYLKEGSYRIKIESGSNISWRSIYISSFKDNSGESMKMTLLSSPLDQFPLDVNITVKDRFTQNDILDETVIYIKMEDLWEVLNSSIREDLLSGSDFELKFINDRYEINSYSINVAHHQTSLNLDVLMSPKAATLNFDAFSGVLKINGREEFFSLDSLRFENLNTNNNENKSLKLLPGVYKISIEDNEKIYEESIELQSGSKFKFIPK